MLGILIIGIYLIISSLVMNTGNFKSAFLFKVLPFFSGLYLLIVYAVSIGVLNIEGLL
jgi:hypothetical protein